MFQREKKKKRVEKGAGKGAWDEERPMTFRGKTRLQEIGEWLEEEVEGEEFTMAERAGNQTTRR